MHLKEIGKVFTSKFVGTGPSYYKKIIYRAAVLQRLRNIALGQWFSDANACGTLVTTCEFSRNP